MSDNGDHALAQKGAKALHPHQDARNLVKLFQCSQCSYPLREPMTLPCGNSLCRPCLPPLYRRENITYPLIAGRTEGFICPFKDCGMEHTLGDCSMDITFSKVIDVVTKEIAKYRVETSDTPLLLDEKLHWQNLVDGSMDVMPRSRVIHGGRIVATFVFASMGELDYHSDVGYTPVKPDTAESIEALDVAVAESLKELVRAEIECQVCYALMLDPLTTSCGHTFCRKCVARVLDHSNLCPICRRTLTMPPGVSSEPSNKRISFLLEGLVPGLLQARILAAAQEDALDQDLNTALFPCTLAYPNMPTFLHIFEPRYRLMVRRAMESGDGRFAMMMYNGNPRRLQGALGQSHFMQYGTLLQIQRIEMFPDGRSLIETTGMYRIRVLECSMRDGYYVGRVQRIEDIPVAEEEAIEARETSGPEPQPEDVLAQINYMSTQSLLQYGLDFIAHARSRSAPWLHQKIIAAYGPPPDDPTTFPYWFASVLPIAEEEKYLLMPTSSVRERLKITARWIQRLEAARRLREAELRRTVLDSSSDEDEMPELETSTAEATESVENAPADATSASNPTSAPESAQEDTDLDAID